MQRRKSTRHVNAANTRWRAVKAQDERDNGIPDRQPIEDSRQPFDLPLAGAGFVDLRIEPRLGYVSWRAVDAATGQALHCAAMKSLLRWIARQCVRPLAARNFH